MTDQGADGKPPVPQCTWVDITESLWLIATAFCIWVVYADDLDNWPWLRPTLLLLASVLSAGYWLNSIPDVVLELRQKPNGIAYKPLCDKILAEHERRQGGPPYPSLWVNNGVDPFTQACVAGISAAATMMIVGGWTLPLTMVIDDASGKHMLKAAINFYVDCPAPEPTPTVIDRLRKANAETT